MTAVEYSRFQIRVARVLQHLRSEFREWVVATDWRLEEDYTGEDVARVAVELKKIAKRGVKEPVIRDEIREYIRSAFRISDIEVPAVVDFRPLANTMRRAG